MNIAKFIASLPAQNVVYFACAMLIVHYLTLIVVQRILRKIRTAEQKNSDLPSDVFSASVLGKYNTYGFLFFYPKPKSISNIEYTWIRICRFSFILSFISGALWLYLIRNS